MTMRILGPLDTGGGPLSPRERAILAALIVRRGTTVAPDELAEACWGERAPRTWPQQIRNAIAKIRAQLGADAVRTVGESYRLGIDESSLDAVEFERRVADARRHDLEGESARAVAAYRTALLLWRGDPLTDVASWPPAVNEAMRLRELRATVEEELLDSRLRAGERDTVIADAERLVREDPLRERRWATLARANYLSDRQAEAIAVLRAARRRLIEDLGIDPSRTLVDLEAAILRHDPALSPRTVSADHSPVSHECPYRGLAAYDVDDRAIFFGRDADADALVERCTRRAVVAVVGPSGSGKSSLVRAGLVPRLRERGGRVLVVTPSEIDTEASPFADDVAVVVLDQAEELLGAALGVVDELSRAASAWVEDGGCLVLTLRSDFLDRATALPRIGVAIGRGTYALSPLGDEGMRLAVSGPAESAGLRVESGLPEVILHDAGDRPGILPALSHALVATWARREGDTLTIAGYEEGGGIAGAIAQSAEQVYRGLSPAGQDACRSVLIRMIERTSEAATLRRRVPLSTLTEDATRRSVVEGLVAARLVTIDGDAAVVAHEAVGRTWPRLDGWLTDDESNARMLRSIEAAAAAWSAAGRTDDDLLRGGRLHSALEWRETTSPDLTDTESAFLDTAAQRHESEVHELERRASTERARNRTLRFALAAASALLVAAIVASGVAVSRSVEADAAADEARLAALMVASATMRSDAPGLSALLAAEAARRWPEDVRVRDTMVSLVRSSHLVDTITFDDDAFIEAALIPGTRSAVVAIGDGSSDGWFADVTVHTVDLDTKALSAPMDVTIPDGWGHFLTISPDGSTAYLQTGIGRIPEDPLTCCKNFFTIIDIPTGRLTTDTVLLDARTNVNMAITPDGARAYFAHPITAEPSWIERDSGDVFTRARHDPEEFEGRAGVLDGVVLLDGELYVAADNRIEVYDADALAPIRTIPLPAPGLAFAMSSDGDGGLLAFGESGSIRVDAKTGETSWRRRGENGVCPYPLAITTGGFLCGDQSATFAEYDLAAGAPTGLELASMPSATRVDALPGGEEVMIVSHHADASLTRWRLTDPPAVGARTNDELRLAMCAMAGRDFTEAEWRTYLGDEPYEPTCSAQA